MNSRAQMDFEYEGFEWNNEVNFANIISALFNNWPEMKLVVERTSEDPRKTVYKDIRKFIQDLFDYVLIYGSNCSDQVSDNIKKSMNDDFHMVIEEFSAKEMSTRICNMYEKWTNWDCLTKSRSQVLEEIKNLPKPGPIVEFEDLPMCKFTFDPRVMMELN